MGKRRRNRAVLGNGRNKHERFVMLWHFVLKSPAWRSLRPTPRAVYIVLRQRFNGANNGHIVCSVRQLARECNCSKDTAADALKELQEKGFIKCAQAGSFHYKRRHAAEWILTEEPMNNTAATKDFMRWQPPKDAGPPQQTVGPESWTSKLRDDEVLAEPVPLGRPLFSKER